MIKELLVYPALAAATEEDPLVAVAPFALGIARVAAEPPATAITPHAEQPESAN